MYTPLHIFTLYMHRNVINFGGNNNELHAIEFLLGFVKGGCLKFVPN